MLCHVGRSGLANRRTSSYNDATGCRRASRCASSWESHREETPNDSGSRNRKPLPRLRHARQGRTESPLLHGPPVALAHQVLPRLEGLRPGDAEQRVGGAESLTGVLPRVRSAGRPARIVNSWPGFACPAAEQRRKCRDRGRPCCYDGPVQRSARRGPGDRKQTGRHNVYVP